MILIEVFAPKGVLDQTQREGLGRRLADGLMKAEGVDDISTQGARNLTTVMFHQPDSWLIGNPDADPASPARYLVRVNVPRSWHSKEFSSHVIPIVTKALADFVDDSERIYAEPHAWVHIVGIAEGSYGLFGRPIGSTELTALLTKPYRDAVNNGEVAFQAPEGSVIDPTCGMTVELNDTAITFEHEGTVYGFCAPQCRQVFKQELAAASAG